MVPDPQEVLNTIIAELNNLTVFTQKTSNFALMDRNFIFQILHFVDDYAKSLARFEDSLTQESRFSTQNEVLLVKLYLTHSILGVANNLQ